MVWQGAGSTQFHKWLVRLMKNPQLSDNLFLEGLSVNQVDSISWDLTAWLCSKLYQSRISGRKGREMEKCGERDGVR